MVFSAVRFFLFFRAEIYVWSEKTRGGKVFFEADCWVVQQKYDEKGLRNGKWNSRRVLLVWDENSSTDYIFLSHFFFPFYIHFLASVLCVRVCADCRVDWETSSIKVKCSSNQANKIHSRKDEKAIFKERSRNSLISSIQFHNLTWKHYFPFFNNNHKLFAHTTHSCGLTRRSFVWKLHAL